MSEHKTILITGATSGIGRATSRQLLKQGHHIIAVGRDFSKFEDEYERLTKIVIDFSDIKTLPEKLKALSKKHKDVDTVICCAGQGQFGSLEEFSFEQIQTLMDVNFTSQAFVTRAFLPGLKRLKRGDLIFMGSESALSGGRRGAIYCASKFALRGMAQALREECARSQVRITVINPGMVKTEFFDELSFAPGDNELNYIEPEDVADAVSLVIHARPGTVFDEINLSPLKKVIQFNKSSKHRD